MMIMDIEQEPRWLSELRQRCRQTSQSAIAKEIGYSAAVINQVLKGTYKGDVKKVARAVRGAFLGETVNCPVLGELERHLCQQNARRPYASTNPTRVKLFKACRGCEHNQSGQEKEVNA